MKQIAIINGRRVYSDKTLSSIRGTRVAFTDGSYCDVVTNEVVNRGPGGISLDSDPGVGETVERHHSFAASALSITNVDARPIIVPHDADAVDISIKGPESEIARLDFDMKDGVVTVREKDGRGGATVVGDVHIGGIRTSGSISIGGSASGVQVISGSSVNIGNAEPAITLKIRVPRRCRVSLTDTLGAQIGDTEGELEIDASGAGTFVAGTVGSTSVDLSGACDVDIKEVIGDLDIDVSGAGEVRVRGGKVSTLRVDLSGAADVTFEGRATDAKLKASGAGSIRVSHVANRPTVKRSGVATVSVGNW